MAKQPSPFLIALGLVILLSLVSLWCSKESFSHENFLSTPAATQYKSALTRAILCEVLNNLVYNINSGQKYHLLNGKYDPADHDRHIRNTISDRYPTLPMNVIDMFVPSSLILRYTTTPNLSALDIVQSISNHPIVTAYDPTTLMARVPLDRLTALQNEHCRTNDIINSKSIQIPVWMRPTTTATVVQKPVATSTPPPVVVQRSLVPMSEMVQKSIVPPPMVTQNTIVSPSMVAQKTIATPQIVVQKPTVPPPVIVQKPIVSPPVVVQKPIVPVSQIVQKPIVPPPVVVQKPIVPVSQIVQKPIVPPPVVVQKPTLFAPQAKPTAIVPQKPIMPPTAKPATLAPAKPIVKQPLPPVAKPVHTTKFAAPTTTPVAAHMKPVQSSNKPLFGIMCSLVPQ
jgi:hypothetical protein